MKNHIIFTALLLPISLLFLGCEPNTSLVAIYPDGTQQVVAQGLWYNDCNNQINRLNYSSRCGDSVKFVCTKELIFTQKPCP